MEHIVYMLLPNKLPHNPLEQIVPGIMYSIRGTEQRGRPNVFMSSDMVIMHYEHRPHRRRRQNNLAPNFRFIPLVTVHEINPARMKGRAS